MRRARLNTFIEPDHAYLLDEIARMRGVSRSAIIAAALASYLSPDGQDRRDVAMSKRLETLSDQFDKLDRHQAILIETVALFIRYYFTSNPPLPEAHLDAARAQGKARFDQFVGQVARRLQRGSSLVRDIHEEAFPEAREVFMDRGYGGDESPGVFL